MLVSIGLILAAALYLLSLTILVKTTGFRKKQNQSPSILHFKNKAVPIEQGIIALFQIIIGLFWLVLWFYFLLTNNGSYLLQMEFLQPHVVTQFITGIMILISGIGVLLDWWNWRAIFFLSIVILTASTFFSIAVYGPHAHGEMLSMVFFGVWSFSVAGIMAFGLYLQSRSGAGDRQHPVAGPM